MRNYTDVIAQLRSLGLLVDELLVDGRLHRTRVEGDRARRGWYSLHRWRDRSGDDLIVGSYGIWQGADNNARKIDIDKDSAIGPDELKAIRRRMQEDRKRADAQRKSESERAARRAESVWQRALVTPPADVPVDYLARKQVGAHGLRYTDSGALIVPMMDSGGRCHGLQFILPSHHPRRKKTGRDKEYWPAGLSKRGRYYLIGSCAATGVVLIAEGYATAATLHEATGLAVAVAFDAGNLLPVAEALRRRYKTARILVCADDDYLQKCRACGALTNVAASTCNHCQAEHGQHNPGVTAAQAAALAVNGAYVWPVFPSDRGGKKLTDYNDLSLFPQGGLALVRTQIEGKLDALRWRVDVTAHQPDEGAGRSLKSLLSMDEASARYALVYGGKGTFFDADEHCLVPKQDVLDILPDHAWREWKTRADRRVVRLREVGFDPSGTDSEVTCNLWGGWPTTPKPGSCEKLLSLLAYLCMNEKNDLEAADWVLRWLAYPIQNPGAKMRTALVFHGPQGTGKNLFFEAVMAIYGEYGRIVDQAAIEDKFNDWASRKLYLIADEVVARQELFHQKNKLKALITGEWIRINPKNVAAHEERNHLNLVFLSNERQPLVIESWDRRYMVIWTPDKLSEAFYAEVAEEIRNGGIAALHHFLKTLDLNGFQPHTKPLVTTAKEELINLSLDSTDRFISDWRNGETPWPFCPAGSMDLYAAYQKWCLRNGVSRPREANQFLGGLKKLDGWSVRPYHTYTNTHYVGATKMRRMVYPSPRELASAPANSQHEHARNIGASEGEPQNKWLTDCFFRFINATEDHQ